MSTFKHTITLADGKPREIAVTMGLFRRLKQKTGLDFFKPEVLSDVGNYPDLITEALVDSKLTVDEVADLMPLAMLKTVSGIIADAIGIEKNDQPELVN